MKKPGIIYRAGREICRTKAAWDKRRKELYARANGMCEKCGKYLNSDMWHAHHKTLRKMGGSEREDALSNLLALCPPCHSAIHVPNKVIPGKEI